MAASQFSQDLEPLGMDHPRILIQLDTDRHSSVFDAVVAVDSGVDHLLQYCGVETPAVRGLVHGAMFTRGPAQLRHTAIFVGGSDVAQGESIAAEVQKTFFGPIRVSVMLDSNGANTTAAAAVLSAARHVDLRHTTALVLGGTGPVGQRVARLLLSQGAKVWLASRDVARSTAACQALERRGHDNLQERLVPCSTSDSEALESALQSATAVFGCGAAGVQLLDDAALAHAHQLRIAIDLNAVPPAGIAGIAVTDKAVRRGERIDYGAIGVGGLKMKIHRRAIETLFTRNDAFLDAEEIFAIGQALESSANV
jgi:methylenetetrahydrofolate/methylenetetrahydromethanopterin dehydrogenase (NADP+)